MNWTDLNCRKAIETQDFQYLFLSVNSILAIVTIVGNSLVLVTIWRTPRLHSPSNVLLAGLALSDLGVGLITQPARIVQTLLQPSTKTRVYCIYYQVNFYILSVFSSNLFISISLFTLTSITVDRYLALRLHLRYQELVTVKRVLIVLLSVWTVGLLLFLWRMFRDVLSVGFEPSVVILTACVLLTIWSYLTIFKTVRRHQAQIHAQVVIPHKGELMSNIVRYRKSVFNILYIVGFFMISYIPCLSVLTIFSLGVGIGIVIKETVFTLMFLNSCVNPVLYCWRMREIRLALKEILWGYCS